MKRLILFTLSILLVFIMACSFASSRKTDAPRNIPIDKPTDVPPTKTPLIIEKTPTTSPFSAEEANSGMHQYIMTPFENGCEASEDSSSSVVREKEHTFSEDFGMVNYAGREYFQVGEHRYQSMNENERPLILEFSEQGFVLYVYNIGDNPHVNDACLYFDFALQE